MEPWFDVYGSSDKLYVLVSLVLWVPLTILFRNPVVSAMVAAVGGLIVCYLASVFSWWVVAGLPFCLLFGVLAYIYFQDYAGR